jgi:hypothetical protein
VSSIAAVPAFHVLEFQFFMSPEHKETEASNVNQLSEGLTVE